MTLGSEKKRRRPRHDTLARHIAAMALTASTAAFIVGCPEGRTRRPSLIAPPTPPPIARAPAPTISPRGVERPPSLVPPFAVASIAQGSSPTLVTAAQLSDQARRELEGGEAARAIEHLEQAIQVDANAPYPFYYLADVYLRRDRAGEALVFAKRAVELASRGGYPIEWIAHSHVVRGRALAQLGDRDEARQAFLLAIEVDPANLPARAAIQRLQEPRQNDARPNDAR